MAPLLFKNRSSYPSRFPLNLEIPLSRTECVHNSFFLKASKLWNSLPTPIKSLSRLAFRVNVAAFLCGLKHPVWHLHGRNPQGTSLLCMLRLGHSPLNIDSRHYCRCNCGKPRTEKHLLLHCPLHHHPRK